MRRTGPSGVAWAAAVAIAIAGVCLAGCAPRTGAGAGAASEESIAAVATPAGIAPELVYTTEVDGYDLAPQSVGLGAADGMTATWFDGSTGAMLNLRTDFGDLTEESCAAMPLWEAPEVTVACADEDGMWHRSGGDAHEYIAVRGDALIWIFGTGGASQADLLTAAKNVRVPSDAELERLFSAAPQTPGEPVERGDLPENGDGAPIDPTGPGG